MALWREPKQQFQLIFKFCAFFCRFAVLFIGDVQSGASFEAKCGRVVEFGGEKAEEASMEGQSSAGKRRRRGGGHQRDRVSCGERVITAGAFLIKSFLVTPFDLF